MNPPVEFLLAIVVLFMFLGLINFMFDLELALVIGVSLIIGLGLAYTFSGPGENEAEAFKTRGYVEKLEADHNAVAIPIDDRDTLIKIDMGDFACFFIFARASDVNRETLQCSSKYHLGEKK
jgi:hypothetical protein